jgi:hypothetical protein
MGKIVTRDEVKLVIDPEGRVDSRFDPRLDLLIAGAEDAVSRFCRQKFWPEPDLVQGSDTAAPVTKAFTVSLRPRRSGTVLVRVPALRVVTSMTLGGGVVTDYRLLQRDAGVPVSRVRIALGAIGGGYSTTYSWGDDQLLITGRWGWLTAPPAVKDAVLFLCGRAFQEQKALFSDGVQTADGIYQYFREIPSTVQFRLKPLRIPNVAVMG